MPVSSTGMTPL
ncbi:hypothetical protein HC356_04785 [Wolbachia pipientis]|uniref:Uncharacterized protein n=2 Tax=Wolbachia TaxID=953 RepID=A0A7G5CED6_WOLPI|nr:hypothetical protein HC356_04785 [Wolbachia pipientis]